MTDELALKIAKHCLTLDMSMKQCDNCELNNKTDDCIAELLKHFVERAEKYKWNEGSPVGVVKENCELEILHEDGEYELVRFHANSHWHFSVQGYEIGYKNYCNDIKAWRYHEPY